MTVSTLQKILEQLNPDALVRLEFCVMPNEYSAEDIIGVRAEGESVVILGETTL